MKIQKSSTKSDAFKALFLSALVTLCAAPVNAATTSFPDYPLLTGRNGVPPNILFILDDSGSMAFTSMPNDRWDTSSNQRSYNWDTGQYETTYNFQYGLSDNVTDRSPVNNTIYYDPSVKYQPWKKADGTRYTTGTSYTSVWTHPTMLAQDTNWVTWQNINIGPGMPEDLSSTVQTYYVQINAGGSKTDNANFTRYEIRTNQTIWRCSWNSNQGRWQRNTECTRGLPANRVVDEKTETNSEALELQNFATWFSYHRTRMKVAKAGASDAFSTLDNNYRVGYDSIWNRQQNSTTGGTQTGNKPAFPIPVATNNGAFESSNKTTWFNYLHNANASGGTPLHGALSRAGRYYQEYQAGDTGDPWSGGNEKPLSCRASYAILTTDGYWNNATGYEPTVGEQDGTDPADTLADVAMNFYNKDLRSDIADNVPANANGDRFQRMTTFGVSIGLSGNVTSSTGPWGDPWYGKTPLSSSGWSSDGKVRIDDLWHAAVNTDGAFVVASNTASFAKALTDAFKGINGKQASGSNLASNGPQVTAGSVKYSAIYHSSEWWGDMRAFPRDIATNSYSTTAKWKLSDVITANPSGFSGRTILTMGTKGGDIFKTVHGSNTTFQRAGVTIANNIQYLSGVRTLEDGVTYRKRKVTPIGDIVNSSPVFVNDNGYLFVGANDGMLHAINSVDGKVAFSYVPKGINLNWMASLSTPGYQHRFFVDGQISVSKLREKNDSNYLVAALGRGGKGVFALDVTKPATMAKGNVVWDATFQPGQAGHNSMGYVLGNPIATRLESGKMVALVPNGIESSDGSATLFVYPLEGNGLSSPTPTPLTVDAGPGNGLMAIETADLDNDKKIDLVYGGDLKGNVWRWDFRTSDAPTGTRIFTASGPTGKPQAITGGLTVVRDGSGRIFVAFGTGRLITTDDLPWNSPQGMETQTIYGIIDNLKSDGTQKIADASAGNGARYSELQKREIAFWGKDSKGRDARSFEYYKPLPETARGWYVDLGKPSPFADGERVVSAPVAAGRALWIDSIWPKEGDGCEAATGNGYMNALDIFTGTNSTTNPSQTNTNGSGTFTFIDVNANKQGDDRLVGKDGNPSGESADGGKMGANDGFITSVAHGAVLGRPDLSDKEVCTQLDDGRIVCEARTPTGGSSPERLMWRELFRGD